MSWTYIPGPHEAHLTPAQLRSQVEAIAALFRGWAENLEKLPPGDDSDPFSCGNRAKGWREMVAAYDVWLAKGEGQ